MTIEKKNITYDFANRLIILDLNIRILSKYYVIKLIILEP